MRSGLQLLVGLAFVLAIPALSVGLRLKDARPHLPPVLVAPAVPVSAAAAPAPAPLDRKARIEHLACFECHGVEAYWKGETFPHRRHEKEMGKLHCHVCHAFEGHVGVVTRKDGCPECHEEGEL